MTYDYSHNPQKKSFFALVLTAVILASSLTAGCAPDEKLTLQIVETSVQSTVEKIPTQTAYPTYTLIPTNQPADTYTPQPTYTLPLTQTAYPTNTPYPTYTFIPTNTAYPTYTPIPTATKTPVRSVQPTKKATPLPTQTAYPTYTPLPTYTPAPTQQPQTVFQIVTATKDPDQLKADKKDGFYLVGKDIAVGTWQIVQDDAYQKCYWKLTDRNNQILNNYIGPSGGAFTLNDSIFQLEIRNCGVAQYVGE